MTNYIERLKASKKEYQAEHPYDCFVRGMIWARDQASWAHLSIVDDMASNDWDIGDWHAIMESRSDLEWPDEARFEQGEEVAFNAWIRGAHSVYREVLAAH